MSSRGRNGFIRVQSYAKINLYLDVIRKRRDGYNDIETIFQTVGLADSLECKAHANEVSLACSNPELSVGPDNLVIRAAKLLQEHSGCTRGATMSLTKRIPVAAGLAGGSGDAAAALVGLNKLWGLGLTEAQLQKLGLDLGSDVPYCLVGGTMAATGRGERLTTLDPIPETWIVLLHPDLHVSTRAVYSSPDLQRSTEKPFSGKTRAFRQAIWSHQKGDVAGVIFNRMETAAFPMHPELATLVTRLRNNGATAAAMSGSGPTLFGICESKDHAKHIAESIANVRSSVVCTVNQGVRVEK